jgi:hypothetical protein
MPTSPTPIAALPTPPSRDDSANFATRGDAFLAALPTFRSETNAVATNVYNNAVEVSSNASTVSSNTTLAVNSATAAAGSAGATLWVSGTTYALGAVVWSPANGQIYRRIVGGAGTTDPSNDSTNWTNVMSFVFSSGNALIGGTSTTTIPILNRGVYLQSQTNNALIGYSLLIEEGVNNRRGSFFLDDSTGVLGLDSSASTGVPSIVLRTAGNDRLRISGGNGAVGIACTPNNSWDAMGVLELGDVGTALGYFAADSGGSTETNIGHGAYFDGTNWKYSASSVSATRYRMTGANAGSTHAWFVSAGGTAGNTVSFTQAMTLDANGVLLRGNTAARSTAALGAGQAQFESAGFSAVQMFANPNTVDGCYLGLWKSRGGALGGTTIVQSGDSFAEIFFGGYDGSSAIPGASIRAVCDGTPGANDMPGRLVFSTTADGSNSVLERGRITSGGYAKFSHDGTYVNATTSQYEFRGNTTSALALFDNRNASTPNGLYVDFSAATPDNNTQYFLYCEDSTTARVVLYSDGDGQNHDNSWGGISDERLKQDIVDANSQWDDIKNLRVRKYRFKSDVEEGKEHAQIGLIAQEVLDVSPGLVTGSEDTQFGVQYSVLYMKAVKALQEAMLRIESLEAKVAALEAA